MTVPGATDALSDSPADGGLWHRVATAFGDWLDGRDNAMDELVTLMTPVLWQISRAAGLDRDDAEDAVQSAWLALVRNAEKISDTRAVAAWLMTTVRRESSRQARLHRRSEPVENETLGELLPPRRPAEEEAITRTESDRLWSAVHTLTERCQHLLRVIAFQDQPDYATIAAQLSVPVGSIGPTRARCLDKLRVALGQTRERSAT